MSRRNRLYIWLAGIVALLGLAYASSPWFLAGLIKYKLSDWDLIVTRIRVGYPGWHGLRLHQLGVSTTVGTQHFSLQLYDTDIEYHIADVLAGNLEHIHVPVATGRLQSAPATAPVAGTISALPLAAMVSGQWLSQIPVHEVQVDQLTIEGRTPSDATYTVELNGKLGDAGLQVHANLKLPEPKQEKFVISFNAYKTGEVSLSIVLSGTAEPIFNWAVNTVAIEQDQSRANGMLHAKLQALAPVLGLWFTGKDWLAALEGEFNCQWQAVVAATGDIKLTLKQIQGTGSIWDINGEVSLFAGRGSGQELSILLQLIKLKGRYKKTVVDGLGAEVALVIGDGLHTTKSAELNIELLHVGLPIENIALRFQLEQHPKTREPVARVNKFAAELLGGRVYAKPFKLDFGKEKNRFMVQLDGVGLNNIMQLEQQAELQGSGVLDGQIPVDITRNGIQVAQGKLSARAPGGKIRYVPTQTVFTLAQTNPGVKLVVDALTDFQYHKLDVVADYKQEGNLLLRVSLEGKNPNWQSGRPVNLNLNLEENIPALLRSLQLSGEITERVRKHYQD